MTGITSRLDIRFVIGFGVALVALVFILAARGGGGPAASSTPTEAATASPSPTPTQPEPIVGERTVTATLVSHLDLLTQQPLPPAAEGAINELLGRTAQLLDDHLNDLNDGGDGLLAALVADELFPTAADADLLGSQLASAEVRAVAARYDLDVAYGGEPRWIRVRVEVDREDGSTHAIDLVLTAAAPQQIIAAGVAA